MAMGNQHGRIIPTCMDDNVAVKPRVLVETSHDILDMTTPSTTTCNSIGNSTRGTTACNSRGNSTRGNFVLSNPTPDYDALLEEVKLRLKSRRLSQRADSSGCRATFGGRSPPRKKSTMSSPTQSCRRHSLDGMEDYGVVKGNRLSHSIMEGRRDFSTFLSCILQKC